MSKQKLALVRRQGLQERQEVVPERLSKEPTIQVQLSGGCVPGVYIAVLLLDLRPGGMMTAPPLFRADSVKGEIPRARPDQGR